MACETLVSGTQSLVVIVGCLLGGLGEPKASEQNWKNGGKDRFARHNFHPKTSQEEFFPTRKWVFISASLVG